MALHAHNTLHIGNGRIPAVSFLLGEGASLTHDGCLKEAVECIRTLCEADPLFRSLPNRLSLGNGLDEFMQILFFEAIWWRSTCWVICADRYVLEDNLHWWTRRPPCDPFVCFIQMHLPLKNIYRKIPTQRPPPSKRPPPFSAPKVLQRGHISSCNRPERLFLGTCRLTLYEKCSVMVTFLFHQLSCQMKLPSNRPSPS